MSAPIAGWSRQENYLWAFHRADRFGGRWTTAVAYVNLGSLNTVVALTIAFVKMLIVLLIFMHQLYKRKTRSPTVIIAGFLSGWPC